MTRKDYIIIARVIKSQPFSLRSLVDDFSRVLKADNPNFKPDKFKTACGL